jgi:hypothetical protein
MTPQQLQILQHSLGVDQYGQGPQYRNFFDAGVSDERFCRELIAMGYLRRHLSTQLFPGFNCSVTEEGKAAMRKASPAPPKLTAGQKRYRTWLRVSDCFPDMTFGQWLVARNLSGE